MSRGHRYEAGWLDPHTIPTVAQTSPAWLHSNSYGKDTLQRQELGSPLRPGAARWFLFARADRTMARPQQLQQLRRFLLGTGNVTRPAWVPLRTSEEEAAGSSLHDPSRQGHLISPPRCIEAGSRRRPRPCSTPACATALDAPGSKGTERLGIDPNSMMAGRSTPQDTPALHDPAKVPLIGLVLASLKPSRRWNPAAARRPTGPVIRKREGATSGPAHPSERRQQKPMRIGLDRTVTAHPQRATHGRH